MRVSRLLTFALILSLSAVGDLSAQTPKKGAPPPHQADREKVNENVVMLLGGALGASYIQLAQDIALTTSDEDNLRVIALASGGAVRNVRDILLLRGVDLGITLVPVLNVVKASGEYGPNVDRRIAYISPLSVDVLHVLARPEYTSVKELNGKKVAVNIKGSSTQVFGLPILKALGVEVEEVHVNPNDAIHLMREGKIDAAVCLCAVPVPTWPALKSDSGFKFLEVPYVQAHEESYLPATLPNEAYPDLIAKEQKVPTVAASTVLITYNWAPGTERYRKIEKFTNAFLSNFDKLRQAPRHPSWRSVNYSATIRGWQRFHAAQQWLDRHAAEAAAKTKTAPSSVDEKQARAQAAKAAPHDAAEQERLFKEFLEWSRKRSR
jgi:TRAP transporter TAXI family solute receptor